MSTKIANKKTNCNKQSKKTPCEPCVAGIPIPARIIADIAGCSIHQVKKVRKGDIIRGTELQVRVQNIEDELTIGVNALIEQVSQLVPISK